VGKKLDKNNGSLCPCCSGIDFDSCCKDIVAGTKWAQTPLALMRSRYVAHVLKNVDHIVRTMMDSSLLKASSDRKMRDDFDKCLWTNLEIVDAPEVSSDAINGIVEFKATYTLDGVEQVLHDRSKFSKINNQWYYMFDNPSAVQPKIGRNERCFCGSHKKYKKCCLAKIS